MIFLVLQAKMSSNVTITIEKEEKEPKQGIVYLVVKVATAERTRRQAVGDALVTLVALPLLVTCAVLLMSTMNSNWVRDGHTRVRVLALGLTLLCISLFVCAYTIYRLGICTWPSAEQRAMPEHKIPTRRRTLSGCLPSPLTTRDSELQLVVSGSLPPSYDSIANNHYLHPHGRTSDRPFLYHAQPYVHPTYQAPTPFVHRPTQLYQTFDYTYQTPTHTRSMLNPHASAPPGSG